MTAIYNSRELRVGIDIGSVNHSVAIGDSFGNVLDEFNIDHNKEGFKHFFKRIEEHSLSQNATIAIAMEGFNGWARPLDSEVLSRGYQLYNVNNVKLARYKEIFPGAAKTDAIDAKKILELFSLQDYLPSGKRVLQVVKKSSSENLHLKRLTRRRRQLVIEKVAIINRLGSDLQAISPGLLAITGKIDNLWFLRFLTYKDDIRKLSQIRYNTLLNIKGVGKKYADIIRQWQTEAHFAEEVVYTMSMLYDDALRILQLLSKIKELDKQIKELCQRSDIATRIMSIPGFGATSCAELAAEIGTLERFDSEASLALYVGMANLDNSSGKFKGSKRSKQVNRHAKMAMINAVSKHVRWVEESKKYYEKKRAEGKVHQQAIRSLGRHLIRVIWSMITRGKDYEVR